MASTSSYGFWRAAPHLEASICAWFPSGSRFSRRRRERFKTPRQRSDWFLSRRTVRAGRKLAQPAKKMFCIGFQTGHEMNWQPAGDACAARRTARQLKSRSRATIRRSARPRPTGFCLPTCGARPRALIVLMPSDQSPYHQSSNFDGSLQARLKRASVISDLLFAL
jgi:hypothetical protein